MEIWCKLSILFWLNLSTLYVYGQQYMQYCAGCDVKKNDYSRGASLEPALGKYYTCATNISKGYEVHVLSVYEGEAPHRDPSDIKLLINLPSRYQQIQQQPLKLKLVLTSYRPITWQISLQEGITVDNITLVSLYLSSSTVRINGVRRDPNFQIMDYLGYGDEIPDNQELFALVQKNYGFITSFTGSYRARQFSLNVGDGQSCTGTAPEEESCHICKVQMNGPSSATPLPGGNFFDANTYSCSTNVVQDYEVHVIAIENVNQNPWYETGQVKVFVNQPQEVTDRSLKLILVANSAIDWMVYTEAGIGIHEVILGTGMSPSQMVADCTVAIMTDMEEKTQVSKIPTYFGYGPDIGKTQDLFDIIHRKYGFITSFTGIRSAKEFQLTTGPRCPAPKEGLGTTRSTGIITSTKAASSTPSTTTNAVNNGETGSNNAPMIAGSVIAAIVLLVIICFTTIILLVSRKKRAGRYTAETRHSLSQNPRYPPTFRYAQSTTGNFSNEYQLSGPRQPNQDRTEASQNVYNVSGYSTRHGPSPSAVHVPVSHGPSPSALHGPARHGPSLEADASPRSVPVNTTDEPPPFDTLPAEDPPQYDSATAGDEPPKYEDVSHIR